VPRRAGGVPIEHRTSNIEHRTSNIEVREIEKAAKITKRNFASPEPVFDVTSVTSVTNQ